jgi:hypothetical protein
MKRRSLFVAVAICISFLRVTVSNAQPSATNGLGLSLQAIDPVIKAGSSPRFSLTVTNVSDHVCRVLDFERRADLRDTYCNLVVLRDGKPVDVLRAISDPGPFSDSDYLLILPGHAKTFMLARFPDQFRGIVARSFTRLTLISGTTLTRATALRTSRRGRGSPSRSERAVPCFELPPPPPRRRFCRHQAAEVLS